MESLDPDALTCDFAEYYNIYDRKNMPLELVATLAAGLRSESRIRMIMAGENHSLKEILLSSMADSLAFIAWTKTDDAKHGRNRPQPITKILFDKTDKDSNIQAFNTPNDFERRREEIMKGGE